VNAHPPCIQEAGHTLAEARHADPYAGRAVCHGIPRNRRRSARPPTGRVQGGLNIDGGRQRPLLGEHTRDSHDPAPKSPEGLDHSQLAALNLFLSTRKRLHLLVAHVCGDAGSFRDRSTAVVVGRGWMNPFRTRGTHLRSAVERVLLVLRGVTGSLDPMRKARFLMYGAVTIGTFTPEASRDRWERFGAFPNAHGVDRESPPALPCERL
jgi:hypothetical protein